jgi:hypothetical protein
MTPLDTLAPDQRAVLELVLRQGRSYGALSELLAIPERDVRDRADAGLRALAGEPPAGVDTGRIADWLLGQQGDAEAAGTRAAVERSPGAREWAATAAERLRGLESSAVPELSDGAPPAGEAASAAPGVPPTSDGAARSEPAGHPDSRAPAAPPPSDGAARSEPAGHPDSPAPAVPRASDPAAPPEPAGHRDSPARAVPRSSKLGGAILIAVLVLVVGGLIAFVLTRGGNDEPSAASQPPEASATPTPTATAATNDIVLRGTNGSKAAGLMRLVSADDGTVRFAIAAQNVPANRGRDVYAVWFTLAGGKPRRLGFAQTQVGRDGVLATGGPQQRDEAAFPRWFATYDKVLITRETDAKATRPGPAVLQGTLPAGS